MTGNIATPLGSDISRTKFDFTGYDPNQMKKKKAPIPVRNVIVKEEDDLEVFVSDPTDGKEPKNIDDRNQQQAEQAQSSVKDQIYGAFNPDRKVEMAKVKGKIDNDQIDAGKAYLIFTELEKDAIQRENNLHDLQVGGQAYEEQNELMNNDMYNQHTLPQIKLERLALELNQLEEELTELEKDDIPSAFGEENDAKYQLGEVGNLRDELQKIVGSEAFQSLDGKTKIEQFLNKGTQQSVAHALNELIERKIVEFSSLNQGESDEIKEIQIGDCITVNFQVDPKDNISSEITPNEKEVVSKFQLIDQTLDNVERLAGKWNAKNKFLHIYSELDSMSDKCDQLKPVVLDHICQRAEHVSKIQVQIMTGMGQLNQNYDQNKIDSLFELLEMSYENKPIVEALLQRLKAIETIHKESPNIETSIKNIIEKQKLIDLSFTAEDQQISKTKQLLLDAMWDVQKDLKEVTMLQKSND